jgi:hypothetical protein
MNDNTQKALVYSSLEALKRCALNILYEERDKGFIRQDAVRMRLGIPKIDYSVDPARHNALIFGILMHLKDDKYVYHNPGYGWQITEKGVKVIEG